MASNRSRKAPNVIRLHFRNGKPAEPICPLRPQLPLTPTSCRFRELSSLIVDCLSVRGSRTRFTPPALTPDTVPNPLLPFANTWIRKSGKKPTGKFPWSAKCLRTSLPLLTKPPTTSKKPKAVNKRCGAGALARAFLFITPRHFARHSLRRIEGPCCSLPRSGDVVWPRALSPGVASKLDNPHRAQQPAIFAETAHS